MLLNNFMNYLFGCSRYDGTRNYVPVNFKNINGDSKTLVGNEYNNQFFYNMRYLPTDLNYTGDFCIVLGTNNTPNTIDYCLWQDDVTTLLTNSGYGFMTRLRDGKQIIRITRTVTNDTTEDITVSEVGLLVRTAGQNVLIAREVLDTPITVAANGGAQVFGIDIG